MATQAEMFAFVTQFGPLLGELAARMEYMEMRIERLEAGHAIAQQPGAAESSDAPEAEFEMFGQKFDMKSMLEGGMPAGGMSGLMDRIKNWKPGQPPPAAPTPPTPPAPEPPKG